MLLIAAALAVAVGGVLSAPYWLGRGWTRDGFWELRDAVYDEWMADGYDSVVLGQFVSRTEVAIDQLPRMSIWTILSTHTVLKKIGRDEMRVLFPEPAELAQLTAEERQRYEAWDNRFSDLVMMHLVLSSWSGIVVCGLAMAASKLSREQRGRAVQLHDRLEVDSKRLVAAAAPEFAPC